MLLLAQVTVKGKSLSNRPEKRRLFYWGANREIIIYFFQMHAYRYIGKKVSCLA